MVEMSCQVGIGALILLMLVCRGVYVGWWGRCWRDEMLHWRGLDVVKRLGWRGPGLSTHSKSIIVNMPVGMA